MTIDVCVADLDAPVEFDPVLTTAERARAAQFLDPRACRRWIASRGWLRVALSRYTGRAAEELTFAAGLLDKPSLADSAVHFSVSRSGSRAVYAISEERSVGVDIEEMGRESDAFLRDWTAREAYLKATGLGLASGLPLPRSGWTIRHIDAAAGFVCAAAADAPDVKFSVRSLCAAADPD